MGLRLEWTGRVFASQPVDGLVVAGCLEWEGWEPPGWLDEAVRGYLLGNLDPTRLPPPHASAAYAALYGGIVLTRVVGGAVLPAARALADVGFDFAEAPSGRGAVWSWDRLLDAVVLIAAGRGSAGLLEGLPLAEPPGRVLAPGSRRLAAGCVRAFIE